MKSNKSINEIIKIKEEEEEKLLKLNGVTGVDVGYKYVKGKRTEEVSIRIHVKKKKKDVPAKDKVPAEVKGITTDVIEREYKPQPYLKHKLKVIDEDYKKKDTAYYDPLIGGISIGPDRIIDGYIFAGTLGAIVIDNLTGTPMMLSNYHVMCIDKSWREGDLINQPSLMDIGPISYGGGSLYKAALNENVDCAVADVSGRYFSGFIAEIGLINGTVKATLGMKVRKRGRTSELTYGSIESLNLTKQIDYGYGIGIITLKKQISIAPDDDMNAIFSDDGDSGSVVVDENNNVVALLFGGTDDGYTICNHIEDVLCELNVSLLTSPYCYYTTSQPPVMWYGLGQLRGDQSPPTWSGPGHPKGDSNPPTWSGPGHPRGDSNPPTWSGPGHPRGDTNPPTWSGPGHPRGDTNPPTWSGPGHPRGDTNSPTWSGPGHPRGDTNPPTWSGPGHPRGDTNPPTWSGPGHPRGDTNPPTWSGPGHPRGDTNPPTWSGPGHPKFDYNLSFYPQYLFTVTADLENRLNEIERDLAILSEKKK